jgi:5-methylcytosine-specific restriction protein A
MSCENIIYANHKLSLIKNSRNWLFLQARYVLEREEMASYLYTWNPRKWVWDDFKLAVKEHNNGQTYESNWSCGVTKKILVGDKFFLMRLGVEPKGIIACGYVTSEPNDLPHWDEDKAVKGEKTLKTELKFKVISEDPIVSFGELKVKFPEFNWTPQASGITIPEHISDNLWNEISHVLGTPIIDETSSQLKLYVEGKPKKVTIKTYDRSSAARQTCIEHYGYNCEVCGFNFGKLYKKYGEAYIEVHHLNPIADIGVEYKINPIKDLRPVCSNCHSMLHKSSPPLSIEELKNYIIG